MSTDEKSDKRLPDVSEDKAFGASFGAAHGAIAGGVVGSLAGPGGTIAGALIGASAGAAIGHVAGAGANSDDIYWRQNLKNLPFYDGSYCYEDFLPALKISKEGWLRSEGASFEDHDRRLHDLWEQTKGNSRLDWDVARQAARAAWDRAARESKSA